MILHSEGYPEVQSNMKKRRGRREIEMSRRRKGRTQEKRDRSTQYSVP